MKPDFIKSKTDPRKYLVALVLVIFFLLTNIIGWHTIIYRDTDSIFNPFLISTRITGSNVVLFLNEFTNKSFITAENTELKRKIVEFEEVRVENHDLKDKYNRLLAETKIQDFSDRNLQLVKISGIQNLYSINPIISIEISGDFVPQKGAPVFYSKNTLFGFVEEVNGRTAKVVPFYSPEVDFNVAVQNSKDFAQKGFINEIDKGVVKVRNIPREASVNNGDIWITTNDIAEVPSGVITGKVKSVSVDSSNGFKEAELELPFELTTTNYLFIALN